MEDTIRTYTNLTITPKKNQGLKKYFNSIRRNLPDGWTNSFRKKYTDNDTFKFINDRVCIKLPKFEDKVQNLTMSSFIHLGLTDSSIIILKIEFDKKIRKEESLDIIGYSIHLLNECVLKVNKHYHSFEHLFEFGGPYDENWYKADLRDERSIKLHSKADNKTFFLAKSESIKLNNLEFSYSVPNNIALSLSLMKKSLIKSGKLFKKLLEGSKNGKLEISDSNRSILFDYFEEIQTSIIFSYIAIEGFSNAVIPDTYKYEKINEKGVTEIWNKENIERWMSTSDKVGTIIPKILNSDDIKKESFWIKFKELEKLRNDIVHQKTIESGTKLDSKLYQEMLNKTITDKIQSSLKVIDFFYQIDNAHPYFPLGLGIARFQVSEIESMEKHFKQIEG